MTGVLLVLAWAAAGVVAAACLHRACFAAAYLLLPDPPSDPSPEPGRRFAVVVPAHDEELLIGEVLRTLRAADYDRDRVRIFVIADNCRDGTAERVRAAGETVCERFDPDHPGKGQAIDWFLGETDLSGFDAVAFIDADNLVDPLFFREMDRRLAAGARVLQSYNGIANPDESVMTRMLTVTYVMKNLLFLAGKTKLGLPVTLMGTGMVFDRALLDEIGWQSMTVGEDLEQSFFLLDHGITVGFVPSAIVLAQESTTLQQGYTQRQRWATGRSGLARRARAALLRGLRQRSWAHVDVALDLLVPTYSKALAWTAGALGLSLLAWPRDGGPLVVSLAALGYQVTEVGLGLVLMRAKARFVASLAFAPIFLAWKTAIDVLAALGHRGQSWTRTARQPHAESAASGEDELRVDAEKGVPPR